MSILKTYQEVNAGNQNLNFGISRMEDIFDKRDGQSDEPHRHNYYTVLFVKKAKGTHKIDFNAYPLSDNQIYFVSPGQVHQIIEEEKSFGYAMTFSNQFLIENNIQISFIQSLHLFNNYGQNPPLQLTAERYSEIEPYIENIYKLFYSNANMKFLSIGAFLKIVLIECNNFCAINPIESDTDSSGDNLIRCFKREVESHYKNEHSTTFYAKLLHITPDHLNRTVKSKIGKTAKDYIQTRIVTEAKRLLYFTQKTNKEITYELGFSEPANFSAFFKKHTELSPTKFRDSTQNR